MKRRLAYLLCCSLIVSIFSGCGTAIASSPDQVPPSTSSGSVESSSETISSLESLPTEADVQDTSQPFFTGVSDPNLLTYVQDTVYRELSSSSDDLEFQVSEVETAFISKEYLDDISYNSQTNSFFGYHLADLDAAFEGTKYVFTIGEDETTEVRPLEIIEPTDITDILKYAGYAAGAVVVVTVTIILFKNGVPQKAARMLFALGGKTADAIASASKTVSDLAKNILNHVDLRKLQYAIEIRDDVQKIVSAAKEQNVDIGAIIGFISNVNKLLS